MDFDTEQRLRNEAEALRRGGCLTWARKLEANGLSPYPEARAQQITHLNYGTPNDGGTARGITAGTVRRRSEQIAAKTYDSASNTIECTWTTGASVLRSDDWGDTYNEELVVSSAAIRLSRLNAGAPFLNSHQVGDLSMQLGSVVPGSARVADGKGTCRLALSNDPTKAGIITDIKGARIRNISVGYRIYKYVIQEGARGEPWTMRVTDWEPFEISAVSAGADPSAFIH